ncbi:hypothetical protein MHU86_14643 [Fragilaria crotonensis]|nr:hypothetical protein MHU86_14643 [Fragilaria crotonensis]
MRPSIPIPSVECDPTRKDNIEDDLSTATPPIGHRNSADDHEFVSKTIRFFFAPGDSTRIDRIDPTEVHTTWMRHVQSAFGDDVKIINNNNRQVQTIDLNAQAHKPTSYPSQFKMHVKQSGNNDTGSAKTAFTVIHRILTRIPFGKIKRHPTAYKLLTDNECFLREHKWDEHEWDIQQVGFVTGYNPKYYTAERVTTMFRARLCKAMQRSRYQSSKLS